MTRLDRSATIESVVGLGLAVASTAAVLLTAGCGPAVLSADDALSLQGESVHLVAFLQRQTLPIVGKKMQDVKVRFFVGETEAGTARTDEDGKARTVCTVPAGGTTRFSARADVDDWTLEATGRIFTWQPDRIVIAVDVDNTICQTDYDNLILQPRDSRSDPVRGARQTLSVLTEDFYILYLTARPRPLLDRTRRWLADQGFPPGPVVTAPRLRDTIRQVKFKRKMLADMRTRCPNLRIGIGDRDADARAYGANRMLSLIVNRSLDQCSPHAIVLPDWSAVAEFFTANHDTLTQPDRLTEASDGRRMLLQPVVPWQGAD